MQLYKEYTYSSFVEKVYFPRFHPDYPDEDLTICEIYDKVDNLNRILFYTNRRILHRDNGPAEIVFRRDGTVDFSLYYEYGEFVKGVKA